MASVAAAAAAAVAAGELTPQQQQQQQQPGRTGLRTRRAPLLSWMQRRRSRRSDTSWFVCAACVLLLVADLSLLSLALPLFFFGFTLVSQHTPRAYWQVALVYAETLLIAQYSFLCLVRCVCETPSANQPSGELSPGLWEEDRLGWCGGLLQDPQVRFTAAWVGLHEHPLRCVPMFIAYLALLMYTYHLAQISSTPQHDAQQPRLHLAAFAPPHGTYHQSGRLANMLASVRAVLGRLYAAVAWCMEHVAFQVYQAYRVAGQDHELGPHWVMVRIQYDPSQPPELLQQQQQQQQLLRSHSQPLAGDPAVLSAALSAEAALNELLLAARGGQVSPPSATPVATPPKKAHASPGTAAASEGTKHHPSKSAKQSPCLQQDVLSHIAPISLRFEHALPQEGSTSSSGSNSKELLLLFEVIAPWASSPTKPPPRISEPSPSRNPQLAHPGSSPDGSTSSARHTTNPHTNPPTRASSLALDSNSGRLHFDSSRTPPHTNPPTRATSLALENASTSSRLHYDSSRTPPLPLSSPPLQHTPLQHAPSARLPQGPMSAQGGSLDAAADAAQQPISGSRGSGSDRHAGSCCGWCQGWAPRAARPAHVAACVINHAAQAQRVSNYSHLYGGEAQCVVDHAAQEQQCAINHAEEAQHKGNHTAEAQRAINHAEAQRGCVVEVMGTGVSGCAAAVEAAAHALPFQVLKAQRHSRRPRDYYTLTLLADITAFVHAAITYRMVVSVALGGGASGTTGDLGELGDTSATLLPIDYVLALMALFGLMVAERTVYTLGSSSAKLVLHWASMAVLLPWCLGLMWKLAANGASGAGLGKPVAPPSVTRAVHTAAQHLRVFLSLRCTSFALGALQLRDGYPPLSAHGAVPGRHDSLFYRRPDSLHFMFFQIYCAVPFLYELRTLLDWTCTATTLDWYNWLKLEDIRASLFVAASRHEMLAARKPGQKVPRTSKIFQGAVILSLLLLVLWLPPLVFSSGAPTYTTPSIESVHLNVTLSQVKGDTDSSANEKVVSSTAPLFVGGPTFSLRSWGLAKDQPIHPPSQQAWWEPHLFQEGSLSEDSQQDSQHQPSPEFNDHARWEPHHANERSLSEESQHHLHQDSQHQQPPEFSDSAHPANKKKRMSPSSPSQQPQWEPHHSHTLSHRKDSLRLADGAVSEDSPLLLHQDLQHQQHQQSPQLSENPHSTNKKKRWSPSPPPVAPYPPPEPAHASPPAPSSAPPSPAPPQPAPSYVLPAYLSGYTPAQVKLMCLAEHSDISWQSSPPAQAALASILDVKEPPEEGDGDRDPSVVMNFAWSLERSAPLASPRSGAGPTCSASVSVPLSGQTRTQLAALLRGKHKGPVPITALDPAYPDAKLPDQPGSPALFPMFWRARGEVCSLRFGLDNSGATTEGGTPDTGSPGSNIWSREMVACSMSLDTASGLQWWSIACHPIAPPEPKPQPEPQPDQQERMQQQGAQRLKARGDSSRQQGNLQQDDSQDLPDQVSCPEGAQGPRAVVVLERVQSGLLGATLSSFGITGLYITFVYGIARLLRLSTSDLRLKIPTEDLPSTQRLVTLCQDIYIARAQGELMLEEELYAALISVYRSPAVLYELTKKRR